MKTNKVFGEYDAFGYRIYLNGEEIYYAGNSPYDSSVVVPLDDSIALKKVRYYCIKTGKEIAEGHKAKWMGATYNPA